MGPITYAAATYGITILISYAVIAIIIGINKIVGK